VNSRCRGLLRRTARLLLVPLAAAVALAAQPRPADSTRRMAERLAVLAQRPIEQVEVPGALFLANAPWRIPAYRDELSAAADPRDQIRLRLGLARQLLWDGQTAPALEEIAELTRIAGDRSRFPRLMGIVQPLAAVAHLRLGEQRNCLAEHNPDSCLFPIRGPGRHSQAAGAREAARILGEILASEPQDLGSRWLLNLAHMTLGTYPEGVAPELLLGPELFESEHDPGRFHDVAAEAGADAVGLAGGVVLEDLDGDGDLDLAVSSWGLGDQLRILENDGSGRFVDRTAAAGIAGEVGGLNLSHADYDGDGDADLLVVRGGWLGEAGEHPDSLLRNEGGLFFVDVTEPAGLLDFHSGQTSAWADYDNDGHLDLFVGNETRAGTGHQPCRLYHNDGDGTFTERAGELGLAELGAAKGAAWGDYDGDGLQDLYVSRLGEPNLLFRNAGRGPGGRWRFEERGAAAGVTEPIASFPTWFWDYDNDGRLDIFVAAWDGSAIDAVAARYLGIEVRAEHPRLFRNRGDGTFEDVTRAAKLDRVLLAMGASFGDLDNDGFEDVYVGTGAPDLRTLMPNRMFRNAGGRVFQDVTTAGGFGHLQKGHGIAFGDVDGDGDQDVYAVMGGWYSGDVFPNALFRNPGHSRHWVTLRLQGTRSNRSGVGARLTLTLREGDSQRTVHRSVGAGGSFGSQSLQQEIGLGAAPRIEMLEVRWPASGNVQRFENVPADRVYRVTEGGSLKPLSGPP